MWSSRCKRVTGVPGGAPLSIPASACPDQVSSKQMSIPETEEAVIRFYTLDSDDLAAIGEARTPETRLSYALQLCCLRYPGRHLRRGETLPLAMLDHVAEQIGVEATVVAGFARRPPTRYDQLAAIKARFGFLDLTPPLRSELRLWLEQEAIGLTDGSALLNRLLDEMRVRRIVVPGLSVVERVAATAQAFQQMRPPRRRVASVKVVEFRTALAV